MRHLFILAGVIASLAACGRRAPSDELFPLAGGHRWTYRVSTEMEDGGDTVETLTLRTMGADVQGWRRRSDDGLVYWLRADETGIYRIAAKTDLEAEPQPDPARRYVLKAPYAPGTQWQASTVPYLLTRRSEFPPELRHRSGEVSMSYRIEAVGLELQTPAGRFGGCLRVAGTASVKVYADPASGWRELPLSTLEWYCPGVGLVRLERREPAHSPFLVGGSRTLELASWE